MVKVKSGPCFNGADCSEQASRQQAGICLLRRLGWCQMALGVVSASLALTMLILVLTSSPVETTPLIGSSIALGASLMAVASGILAFRLSATFDPSDSDISSSLRCMLRGHYGMSMALLITSINALVWLGRSLAQVETLTMALKGVTITTLVLTVFLALLAFVGLTVYCRIGSAFPIWGRCKGSRCQGGQEQQLKQQQQGGPQVQPAVYDNGLTKDKSQGGFPAGYSAY